MTIHEEDLTAEAVKSVIAQLMDGVLRKVLETDPFVKEKHHTAKPLYAALVPDEIFKGSHFERRFVTPFGGVWEKLTDVVAKVHHGHCSKGHTVHGLVNDGRLKRIQEVLNRLEHSKKGKIKTKPDWNSEVDYILQGTGEKIATAVVCDIFINSSETNKKYAFELKAPLPNSDQTKVSKEKMFKLLAMEPKQVDFAFFALPYNPYGAKKDYAWSFPQRWFNMHTDESVLIGDEFWTLVGGLGTYEKFITEINLLGTEYKYRIYREFLNMEPPESNEEGNLK
jgi:hypothetical protein